MTDIQAAIGLVQLRRLAEMLRLRAEQARYYDNHLGAMDELRCPFVPEGVNHCYSSYCIQLAPGTRRSRDEILEDLADHGISCRRGIPPLYAEPFFRQRLPNLYLPVSEEVAASTLFLPIFPGLTEEQQARVVAALKESLR